MKINNLPQTIKNYQMQLFRDYLGRKDWNTNVNELALIVFLIWSIIHELQYNLIIFSWY